MAATLPPPAPARFCPMPGTYPLHSAVSPSAHLFPPAIAHTVKCRLMGCGVACKVASDIASGESSDIQLINARSER